MRPLSKDQRYNATRKRERPFDSWYKRKEWTHKLRPDQLLRKPMCEICGQEATEVHHRIAHAGDEKLFRDPTNLQSLCKRCHTSRTRGTIVKAIDVSGRPLDPTHHWNKPGKYEKPVATPEQRAWRDKLKFGSN